MQISRFQESVFGKFTLHMYPVLSENQICVKFITDRCKTRMITTPLSAMLEVFANQDDATPRNAGQQDYVVRTRIRDKLKT